MANIVVDGYDEKRGKMYDYTDPNRVGRGVWYFLMVSSLNADDDTQRIYICKQLRDFCSAFKCLKCSKHCAEYIKKNPPEIHTESNDELFNWIVNFMNEVNIRTNRPPYNPKILRKIIIDTDYSVCSDCGNKSEEYDQTKNKETNLNIYQTENTKFLKIEDEDIIRQLQAISPGLIISSRSQKPILKSWN